MRLSRRNVFSYLALAAGVAAVAWAVSFRAEEPADLTFCNGVEIKSIDPKVVTGSAEGRVLRGLFEGYAQPPWLMWRSQ